MEKKSIFSISKMKENMKDKPSGNKIYDFFNGAYSYLNEEQKNELIEIVKEQSIEVITFLENSKTTISCIK